MHDPTTPTYRNQHDQDNRLSPLPVRLLAWTILISLALATSSLIDEHAMNQPSQLEQASAENMPS